MADIFLKIVNMSISACWIVLAIILFRFILKKAPKWINCILWGFVGLRLVMPFSFESLFSLMPSAEFVPSQMIHSHSTVEVSGAEILNYVGNNPVWYDLGIRGGSVVFNEFAAPDGNYVNPLLIITYISSVVWLVGIAALLIYTLISFLRLKAKIGTAVLLRDNIYQSETVVSPFVLGIIKPKIYLPFNMNGQDMDHVIAHEQAHIRRKDYLWKPLGFLILTLHWFNPIVWFGYILLCRDIELACDEKVAKELSNEQRADYSQALLTCSVNRRIIAACPLAFGESGVKVRVKAVLNYKKPTFWVIAVSVIASVVVAVCFLTNPASVRLAEIENDNLDGYLYEQHAAVMALDGEKHRFVGTVEDTVLRELFDIRISKKEVSLRRDEGRDKTNTLILNTVTEEQEILTSYIDVHFNADFSEVWVDNNVKSTLSYKVLNPEKAKEIYDTIAGTKESAAKPIASSLLNSKYETGKCIYSEVASEKKESESNDLVYSFSSDGTVYKTFSDGMTDKLGKLKETDYTTGKLKETLAAKGKKLDLGKIKNAYEISCESGNYVIFRKSAAKIYIVSFSAYGDIIDVFKLKKTGDFVSQKLYISNRDSGSDLDGVSLRIAYPYLSSQDMFMDIEWINNTSDRLLFGEQFAVFYNDNGRWINCSTVDDPVWHLIAYIVEPKSTVDKTYNLNAQHMDRAGEYRFEAYFSIDGHPEKNYKIWLEFEVEENAPSRSLLSEKYDLIPMVMIDGELYLDTGYKNTDNRKCGTPDGKITSQVDESKKPHLNDQSNFGTGYEYQYGSAEGTVEINIDGAWLIFATQEARQQQQFGTNSNVTSEMISEPHSSVATHTMTCIINEINANHFVVEKVNDSKRSGILYQFVYNSEQYNIGDEIVVEFKYPIADSIPYGLTDVNIYKS